MWDDSCLYLAAQMTTDGLLAAQTIHDSNVFLDDCFELFLDPDSDGQNYLEWEVNPLGTTLDLRMDRPYLFGGTRDDSWEIPGLELALSVTGTPNNATDRATSWSFESAFPWQALGKRPSIGETWLCNLMRVAWPLVPTAGLLTKDPDSEERYWVAQPTGLVDIHRPSFWAVVAFVETVSDPTPTWPGSGPVASLVEQTGIGSRTRAEGSGMTAPVTCQGWTLFPDGRFAPSA